MSVGLASRKLAMILGSGILEAGKAVAEEYSYPS